MGATKKRTAGRPLELTRVISTRTTATGTEEFTVGDRIVAGIRAGNPVAVAAAAAGVTKQSYMNWLHTAARVNIGLAAGGDASDYTDTEIACAEWGMKVMEAEAQFEVWATSLINAAATGGQQFTTTIVKTDADGNVVESTERTETMRPDWRAAHQRLVHRHPERYATTRLDVSVGAAPLGVNDPEPEDVALEALRSLRQWRDAEAVDASSKEVTRDESDPPRP